MYWVVKSVAAIAALTVALALAIPVFIHLKSEAVIQRRYPLPVIAEPAASPMTGVARGAHLATIAGCADCHGPDFTGRRESEGPLQLWSSNLRIAAAEISAGEFERALRRGLAPDATSLWGMPSDDYMYMSEADTSELYTYLRSLGSLGPVRPRPVWNWRARLALLDGRVVPAVVATRDAPSSLDLGPRYDGGRYLARLACSACHATDLAGSRGAPDLLVVGRYSRAFFFDLLRRGWSTNGRRLPVMKRLARMRFHAFADYEIVALYDYLSARARAPAAMFARARANEVRRRETITLESDD
jgi:mono/diheme cytochrome c family protein